MSTECSFGPVDEVVEEGGSFGLAVVAGVVSLADEDGDELGSGLEVPSLGERVDAWVEAYPAK